ncbi:MAG: hypothetical protein JW840_09115 [Candidatus Thermoplasmatota archaeon]|nr:hypothetical protein [Candidatus Thermoplasmatota archaeon]
MTTLVSYTISGQTNESTQKITFQKTLTVSFSENDFLFFFKEGYNPIYLSEGKSTTEIGKPMLPIKNIRIALPSGMKATTIHIDEIKEQTLKGTYLVYPAQPASPLNRKPEDHDFIRPDFQTYQSNQIYPSKSVELISQSDLAGQSIASIILYPIHYLPSQKKLSFIRSITFTIEGTSGYIYGDYLPHHIASSEQEMIQHMLENMVINPDDVVLHSSAISQKIGVDPGNYDYVIITQDSWVDAFQPLKDWKTKKGIPANIVTTTWIYNSGGYSGSSVDKIRSFVQDVYTNWGTRYILLGGDVDVVPCHYRTFSSVDPDPVPNDAYYADFDSDWICEVHVGRASVTGTGSGTGKIGNFINKIMTYEKNPSLTDFAKNAGFFGFDLDSHTHAQQCKINIDTSYVPSSWIMTTVYDSDSGNHRTNVISALNAGQNLMNHADHSGSDFMGTGYVNHDIGLWNADMDALTNGNKQGILYSMGCDPAAYDSPNCIAEHFVRNSNGGGVAFIGNSRYGWYYVGDYNTLSMGYDVEFFKSIFQDNLYKLGTAFSDHKNDEVESTSISKYCFTELTLLGDPELPLWKENPISMTAIYPSQLPVGPSSFTISVTSGSIPLTDAYVCLWKGTDVYLTGTTDGTGEITFSLSPSSPGTMYVTVTKQNYLPIEGQTIIINGTNSPPLKPNTPTGPLTGGINMEYAFSSNTTDPDEDQVWYQWSFGSYTTNWLGPYPSGATAQSTYQWGSPGIYEVKVKAKDQNDLQSDWSEALLVTITDLQPQLEIGIISGGFCSIGADIWSTGEIAATNINWSITVDGNFIFLGNILSGSIEKIDVSNSATIEDSPVFGFGNIIITVAVSADGLPEITKSVNGFLFFIYIII